MGEFCAPTGARVGFGLWQTAFGRNSVRAARWMWVPGLEVLPYECEIWER